MLILPAWFRDFIGNRWVTTFFGFALLAVLIWFFGPLLAIGQVHPFDSELVRLIFIAALFVAWLILNLVRMLHARKRESKMVEEVTAPDKDATASAEEVALLAERLKDALHQLKHVPGKSRWRRHRLYDFPWYMFIGPPGAGKTTALVNSGLKFPLADAKGPAALRGVGGTRNCDWWFTDEAVLIDTAGRYTTQDSHAAVDASAWVGFLRLLKKHRRRQPLNGVLLAIGLPDLAAMSESERLAHAGTLRKRIRELQVELGVSVPVYVLFTKADLISGFVEFFDSFGKEEREQVWGVTLPLEDGKEEAGTIGHYAPEFDLLLQRLNDRMLERVNQESDIQRRRLIYGFPQQMASLRDLTSDFLTEIFRPSRLEERPLLRGVYLTSGTQDGTPIDRLLGVMAGQFGLQRQAVTAFSGTGRSYFLTRLMRDVVFGEAALVSFDKKVERRNTWIYRGAYAGAALVLVLCTAGWTRSYIGNRLMIDEAHSAAEKYNAQIAEVMKRGPNDTDLMAVLPPLHTIRTMRGGYDQREAETPISLTFGLYQGNKITDASVEAYYRALNGLLLPRLLSRLENQLVRNFDKPDFLYEALKVYLMLGRQGPLGGDDILVWFSNDFNVNFPGDDAAEQRQELLQNIEAMVQRPLTQIALNGPLIAKVREILNSEPVAEYSYNRIMRSPRVTSLPVWTIADNGGPSSDKVFTLRSGKPLNTGMPGIFTWSGYHMVFLPVMPTVTQDIEEDAWVLGRERRTGAGGLQDTLAAVNRLRRDVVNLYLDEYVRRWDRLLGDIAIKRFSNLNEAVDELQVMSGPGSPLRLLLQAIDQQTQLSRKAATETAESQAAAKAAAIGSRASGLGRTVVGSALSFNEAQIAGILGEAFGATSGSSGPPPDPASRVDEHFKALHDFVAGSKDSQGSQTPLEAAIAKIGAIAQNMIQVANAPNQGQALIQGLVGGGAGAAGGGTAAAAAQLADLAKSVPQPVASMLQTVSQSSTAVAATGASRELVNAWRVNVLPLCDDAFLNRYPFVAGSDIDVPIDDFTKLLGPGGLIDTFFNQNLKPFVDTTTKPWKWQAANNAELSLHPGTLTQFENAATIRDSLFSGQQILVKFTLLPVNLDPGVAQITLDIGGQTLTYNHGPTESMSFQWPGQGGKTLVRETMTPTDGSNATIVEKDGPWALLRLLDTAKVVPSGQPDRFRLIFTSPAGSATFELNAASVRNPFTLTALRAFRCPSTL